MNEQNSKQMPAAPPPRQPGKRQVPLQVRIRTSFGIGGELGQGVIEVNSTRLDTIQNKTTRVEVDHVTRGVWVFIDTGNGFVSSGWTPFENVMGINYGVESTAKPAEAVKR